MGGAKRSLVILAGALALGALGAAPASANRLNQVAGVGGCVIDVLTVPDCTQQTTVGSPRGVLVRDNHVYVSSGSTDRINIYDRDPVTGGLTPRTTGLAGCIADDGPGSGCADGRALEGPGQMAMSADGTTIYVAATTSNGVAVISRDPTTGNLSQPGTISTCITKTGTTGSCNISAPMDGPVSLAISPDGSNLYVAGQGTGAGFVTVLDILPLGLQQHFLVGGGCFEETVVTAGCGDARAMNGARIVQVTPDGEHVYVSASTSDSVTGFIRGAGGALGAIPGSDGCLGQTGVGQGCLETDLFGDETLALAFASNQRAYVGSVAHGSVTLLARNAATGGLTAPGPCASATTSGPLAACTDTPDMFGLVDFVIPPGKGTMIATARFGRGLIGFTLGPAGEPIPVAPPAGCLATGGTGQTTTCTIPRGFARDPSLNDSDFGAIDAALSDDGRFLYAVSSFDFEDRPGIIAVKPDTGAPACQDAAVEAAPGATVQLPLSCTDPDGDAVALSVVTAPAQGTTGAVDQGADTVAYTAPADFQGSQTLTFKGTALGFDSALATVTISAPAPPAPPADTVAPSSKIGKVTCTKSRRCTIKITASDPGGGTIRKVEAKLTIKVKTCRRVNGQRKCTTKTSTKRPAVAQRGGGYQISIKLPKSRCTLNTAAVDAAGNRQAPATRKGFRVA